MTKRNDLGKTAVLERILQEKHIGFLGGPEGFRENLPTLVMVHGAGGCSQVWQNQATLLGKALNTLAIDLPGHGKTPGPAHSTIEAYAVWLRQVLIGMDMEAPFLMGHSMGGAVVQEAALTYPELLGGIVLAGTGPHLPVAPNLLEGLDNRFEETVDTVIRYAYARNADPNMIRQGAALMKEAGSAVVHEDFLACDRFDRRKEIHEIRRPCLIICGEEDRLTPPALSRSLNDAISGSELFLLPSSGHMVMLESFKTFNRTVRHFVLKNSGRPL